MKKNVVYLLLAVTLFYGCSEDFLDPVRNTNVLTDESITDAAANNPDIIEGNLTGISGFMIDPGGITGGRHYDLGQKGIDIWSDVVSGDAALSASTFGWYNNTANLLTTVDFTREENEIIWNYYFRVISVANSVIQTAGGNNAGSDLDANTLRVNAQAKAYRAYAYFYLTQFFQTAYDPAEPILPLYAIDQVNSAKVEASVIYDLIVSDLLSAIENLDGYTRTNLSEIDTTVAQGLLAYTYAAMGDYANAKIYADAVINAGYPLMPAGELAFPGAGSGFNDVASPSWVWGFDITADLGHQLLNWWGQMDYFTYSYAWAGDTKSIDDLLYSQIPANDIRSTQFGTGAQALQPINKFFDPGRTPGGQFVITTDYIFMRVEEFYLLSAECAARTGDETTAKNRLRDLLTIRYGNVADANTYLTPLTGSALQDAIYLQTRIELWGEGKSYLAMKRNQATVTRGTNHVFRAGESFQYDSDEMSFQIPETEIINNPNISSQNN
ncbi:MAG: RagB/SusD family nutrient uptake outer membrane protein [Winogradskyella sp.]|uniref:RagB/SusD family nutrient uptake outer membrane protein n=1 Tax=Winogradskyella sp. TaxID=1883156 RepID=UPI0025EB2F55|nr:RagB/SusD family nutrient uptake outer membrane protein [Winogradskyella sp.]NRB60906.1 RagB/SusD family nutrient uptake outer membrane protein [Winogradskyella sp.]